MFVHVWIFLVAVFFVIHAVTFVMILSKTYDTWEKYACVIESDVSVMKAHKPFDHTACGKLQRWTCGSSEKRAIVEWHIGRRIFLERNKHEVAPNFDFSKYLELSAGETVLGLLEISTLTWMTLVVMLLLNLMRNRAMGYNGDEYHDPRTVHVTHEGDGGHTVEVGGQAIHIDGKDVNIQVPGHEVVDTHFLDLANTVGAVLSNDPHAAGEGFHGSFVGEKFGPRHIWTFCAFGWFLFLVQFVTLILSRRSVDRLFSARTKLKIVLRGDEGEHDHVAEHEAKHGGHGEHEGKHEGGKHGGKHGAHGGHGGHKKKKKKHGGHESESEEENLMLAEEEEAELSPALPGILPYDTLRSYTIPTELILLLQCFYMSLFGLLMWRVAYHVSPDIAFGYCIFTILPSLLTLFVVGPLELQTLVFLGAVAQTNEKIMEEVQEFQELMLSDFRTKIRVKMAEIQMRSKEKMTDKQLAQILFDELDEDKGGSVDGDELEAALSDIGIELREGQIGVLLRCVDEDGSGEIEFEEFYEVAKIVEEE